MDGRYWQVNIKQIIILILWKITYNNIYNKYQLIYRFAKENVLRVLIGNKNDLDSKRVVQEEEGRDLGKLLNPLI